MLDQDSRTVFKKISLALLNLFYPKRCISCKMNLHYLETKHLCGQCWDSITSIPEPFCDRCGIHLPDGGMYCFHCKHEKIHFTLARCAGTFTGALRELVHHLKYRGKNYLAAELAQFLRTAWKQYPELQECEVVVPVPLHSSSLRERGYNQSALLAKEFIHLLHENSQTQFVFIENLLIRGKKTRSQTQLSREDRMSNVESAFEIEPGRQSAILKKNVLLIDDVCTTGATLNACAKVLHDAGAKRVYGLTLARD